jgi:hypothetical protein
MTILYVFQSDTFGELIINFGNYSETTPFNRITWPDIWHSENGQVNYPAKPHPIKKRKP